MSTPFRSRKAQARSPAIERMVHYGALVIGCSCLGAIIGGVAGVVFAILASSGYHRYGPSDPADATIYLALALVWGGCMAGATSGMTLALVICRRMSQRRTDARAFNREN